MRGRLLGLEADDSPSKSEIECSSHFHLRTVVFETEPPEVVAEHWLDSLREDGILVECPLDQFTAPEDWIPLYTSVSLQHYLPAALSAFPNQRVPSLIAVAPPDFHVVLLHCGCLSLNPFIEFSIQNNSSSSDVLNIQASISISPKYVSK